MSAAQILFLADLSAGCRFTAQVEKSQEGYLVKGAPVTLANGQKKQSVEDLEVDLAQVICFLKRAVCAMIPVVIWWIPMTGRSG